MSTQNVTPQFNEIVGEPALRDVLNLVKKEILLTMNCHHLGTIKSFNSELQTATATINYSRTRFKVGSDGVYQSVLLDYPPLVDCPVICLGGGNASLTFPIAAGDECLILFNDRNMDNWVVNGAGGQVADPRMHSFSDGVILVGLRSNPNSLDNYDATRAVLQNGSTKVTVGPTLIGIKNETYDLNTLLQNLITQIENLVTATAAITVLGITSGSSTSGVPANAATITAIGTSLTTIATQIGELLE